MPPEVAMTETEQTAADLALDEAERRRAGQYGPQDETAEAPSQVEQDSVDDEHHDDEQFEHDDNDLDLGKD